jgi:TolB-like protein
MLVLGGCVSGPTTSFVNENVSFGYIQKIAVLPFENHTQAQFVEERIRDIATTEVLSRGLFDVAEKGDLERFLREEMVVREHYSLDLATSKRLIPRLKTQAYLAGSVDDFTEMRNGPYSYPVVAVTLRLVDSESGKIIWQASGHESGYSTADRLFGLASDDANQVTFKLIKRLLDTLAGE